MYPGPSLALQHTAEGCMEKVYTWHCSANLSKMERQRSTRCAASLYPGNGLLLDDKVLAGKARTRLAAVSRSQHSLHGDISMSADV